MFTKQSLALQLAEGQLTKLTSESEEIRMRALDQIETRFIRCLQLGEPIQFKPVLLLKQLIRWFGYTPPLVPDRVLAMIMELLRSEYAEAVIRKIPYERFKAELEKVRRVLHKQESKRISELLDDINLLLLEKYKIDRVTPSVSSLSSNGIPSQETESADSSSNHIYDNLKPEDYEPAWSYPCLDDVATMKNMIDMPRNGVELQLQLTELIIRMGDYPIEYFLQPPFVFLHLVQLQTRKDGSLLHVNRALIACLRLLQHRVLLRRNTLSYAASFEPPSRPKQLKVGSALVILLDNCMALIRPLLLSCTADNWHIMELIVEIVRTYDVLSSKIPLVSITLISDVVNRLLAYCNSVEGSSMTQLMDSLRIPRLQSLILNGVLHDMVALNINYDKNIDRRQAKALIQPIILDSAYVSCIPERMEALNSLISSLDSGPSPDDQLIKLKRAYSVALNQLQPNTELTGSELIKKPRQVCHVIVQLRSETLVKQLFKLLCSAFHSTRAIKR
ncbi:GD10860 [Drosophila simulans]|uniref:GD10860 n=1 Tax=Drosophila simulans TaxID=7240 RepID=B4QCT2_DROSI|nr:GD10860 [Drosophila simulans]